LWCSFDHFFLHLGALAAVFLVELILAKFRRQKFVACIVGSDVLTKNLEKVGGFYAELC